MSTLTASLPIQRYAVFSRIRPQAQRSMMSSITLTYDAAFYPVSYARAESSLFDLDQPVDSLLFP